MPEKVRPYKSPSERISRVPPSVMFELADKIRQLQSKGREIIDLSLGQPEVPAPAHISRAMQEALETPLTSYTSSAGSIELRRLIAERYTMGSGVDTGEQEVIVTSGSKHALFISLLSLVDPGDEILVHEPFFPAYTEIAELTEAKLRTVPVSTSFSDDTAAFKLDLDQLFSKVTPKTKLILLNYPNNPAGWTLGRDEVKRVADYCSGRGIYLLSDEIYDRIVFDGRNHCHAWSFSADSQYIIGLGSFSKTYSMVPFRLGYIIARRRLCEDFLKSQRATITMVSPYIQKAGVAALTGPQDFIAARCTKYQERRDRCVSMLRKSGVPVHIPQGAFYLFVKMPEKVIADASEFVLDFLENEGIALFPGSIFGERWKGYVRISLATEDKSLYHAVERFAEAWASIASGKKLV